eukprot:gene2515-3262_t
MFRVDTDGAHHRRPDGRTLLHFAAAHNLRDRATVKCRDNHGNVPLHVAMIRDDPNIARALIAHKADVNDRNYEGQTPLHLACYQGNARVVACLLARRGVDARCLDRVGNNALHYAARCSTGKCMWLCLHGMHNEDDDDAQIMVDYRNNFGMTAAHVAAEYANLCALDSLRSHSADLSLTCNDDYIMLDRCVRTCGTYRGTAMYVCIAVEVFIVCVL